MNTQSLFAFSLQPCHCRSEELAKRYIMAWLAYIKYYIISACHHWYTAPARPCQQHQHPLSTMMSLWWEEGMLGQRLRVLQPEWERRHCCWRTRLRQSVCIGQCQGSFQNCTVTSVSAFDSIANVILYAVAVLAELKLFFLFFFIETLNDMRANEAYGLCSMFCLLSLVQWYEGWWGWCSPFYLISLVQ